MNQKGELKKSLKTRHIVFIGIAFMAPAAVFDTFGITSAITKGHVPLAYIIACAAILFTAASYGSMVKAFPVAGSAYTYTQRAINPNVGFMVGWLILLDYLFIPLLCSLLTGIYMSTLVPQVPFWAWVLGFAVLITVVNMSNVKIAANFNLILVAFQLIFIVIFIWLVSSRLLSGEGNGTLFSTTPFINENFEFTLVLVGASILAQSFLGFDAVTTLAEETEDPKKTIPRAIFLVASLGGAIFITVSYFAQSLFSDITFFNDLESASAEMAFYLGGLFFQAFFTACAIVGNLASGIASQASGARLLYVMGRENVLPKKIFGYIHPRLGAPTFNVILIGFMALLSLFVSLEVAVSFINFGALVAFSFVNISVIAHYAIKNKRYKTIKEKIVYILFPLLGAASVGVLWVNLERNSFLLGMSWAVAGFIYLLVQTRLFTVKPPQFDFEE